MGWVDSPPQLIFFWPRLHVVFSFSASALHTDQYTSKPLLCPLTLKNYTQYHKPPQCPNYSDTQTWPHSSQIVIISTNKLQELFSQPLSVAFTTTNSCLSLTFSLWIFWRAPSAMRQGCEPLHHKYRNMTKVLTCWTSDSLRPPSGFAGLRSTMKY